MDWLIDNWYVVIALICGVALVGYSIFFFIKLPNAQKIQSLKEWLKFAVVEAEKALKGGTGQLKLHMVYDMAIEKFPWLTEVVSFSTFSYWVDEALEWMRTQLSTNKNAKNYVEGVANENK